MRFCSERPTVSVLIPAKNEEKYIENCITSILSQDYPKELIDIIVIDNESSDRTRQIAEQQGVNVVSSSADRIGAVRNVGVSQANSKIIAFIDGDCVANDRWLSTAVSYLLEDTSIGAIGGDALLRPGASYFERCWFYCPARATNLMTALNGASMVFTKDIFCKIGGFRENINAGEDTVFSHSIRHNGYKIIWTKESDVVHLGYPRNVVDFFKRQFWLASSYLQSNIGRKEKMYWFTIISLVSLITAIVSLTFSSYSVFCWSLGVFSLAPSLFFLKKISGAEFGIISINSICVYSLCYVYFLARSLGLLYSVSGRTYYRVK